MVADDWALLSCSSVTNVLKWLCFFLNPISPLQFIMFISLKELEGLNSEINNGNQAFQSLFDCLMKNEDMAPGSGLIIIN